MRVKIILLVALALIISVVALPWGQSASALSTENGSVVGSIAYVKTNGNNKLNVRSATALSAPVISQLSNGETVRIVRDLRPGWFEVISVNSSKRGYVSDSYIQLAKSNSNSHSLDVGSIAYVKTNGNNKLNVRSATALSAPVISQLSNGETVQIVRDLRPGWFEVISVNSSKRGYVSDSFIVASSEPCVEQQYSSSSNEWIYPMDNAFVCGNNWGEYYTKRPTRPFHSGIDIASRTGSTNVKAAANGTVVKTGWNDNNGYYVVIKHRLGQKSVFSFYAHLASISCPSSGYVSQGTKIGVMGNTGSASAGAHLHFAIVDTLKNGSYYGYISSTSNTTGNYSNVTYFNPHYVVNNDRLPT